jgi:hypothetical protein
MPGNVAASAPDWVARGIAVGALAVSFFGQVVGRRDTAKKRKARGCPEVRDLVRALRSQLEAGIDRPSSLNGLWSPRVGGQIEELADLVPSLADRSLSKRCLELLAQIRQARGEVAPRPLDARDQTPALGVDVAAAEKALATADEVLVRLSKVIRKAPA